MDVSYILENLNKPQRQAVTSPIGKLRVLAGAGSGKTKVLVHRIAWILASEQASTYQVLAVTFTNKAAAEMKGRIQSVLGQAESTNGFWVGTFHGICHRILRIHFERVGLIRDFQILDRADQTRLIKRIMKDFKIDESFISSKLIINEISNYKENGKRFTDVVTENPDPILEQVLTVYKEYEIRCKNASLVDFAELLLLTVELLDADKTIKKHYQNRFKHILVDEFQDTNKIQYKLIQLLTNNETDLFVVGDDDQSIYGFRGAKVEHILDMQNQYKGLETIKLEQNYRSTANILNAANAIISKNHNRLGKELWTESGDGDLIDIYKAMNEEEEAYFVCNKIKSSYNQGINYSENAILYRSNAQSRILEKKLDNLKTPYRVYGGFRFYDRAEVKDAIAYLRVAQNSDDDIAFDRIVNFPTRGIGLKTLTAIREYTQINQVSMLEASQELVKNGSLPNRANICLSDFLDLIIKLKNYGEQNSLKKYLELIINTTKLFEFYEKKDESKGKENNQSNNLLELISAGQDFEKYNKGNSVENFEKGDESIVASFLAQASLDAGDTQADKNADSVQLMTLHSAKGLEFDNVFLVGVEEGLFPHSESALNPNQLEEERRLAYVGITRAQKKLFVCYTEQRMLYGKTIFPEPSRFIEELPEELVNHIRPKTNTSLNTGFAFKQKNTFNNFAKPKNKIIDNDKAVKIGQRVFHPKFKEGVVTDIEGDGDHLRAQINFADFGSKWLILAFAKIDILD